MKVAMQTVQVCSIPARKFGFGEVYTKVFEAAMAARKGQAVKLTFADAKAANARRMGLQRGARARGLSCILRGNSVYVTKGAKAAPSNGRGH